MKRGARLRAGLAARAAGLAAASLAAVVIVLELSLVRPLAVEADEALRDRLDSLAAVVAEGGEQGFRRQAPGWVRAGRNEFAALRDPKGDLLASAGRVSSSTVAAAADGAPREVEDATAGRFVVLSRGVADPAGRALTAVAGISTEDLRARQASLRILILAVAAGGVILVAAGAWFGADLVLAPLHRMTAAARGAGGAAGARLPARDPGDEFDDLARLLNDLLARAEASLEEERRFVGEAAHELRSPVSVLRLRAEKGLAAGDGDGVADARAALEGVLADADRIHRLIQALLELSRASSTGATAPPAVDAAAALGPLAEDLGTLAAARGLALEWVPPPAGTLVAAPREVLETTVSVLVDNAFRYTPRGGTVALSSALADGSLRLAVRDTGPGVDAAEAPRVFERMFRGRAGKASGGGFGLGLPLARRLARSVRGEVALDNPGEAGAQFSIRLPLAG